MPNGTINNSTWYTADSIWIYDYTNTPRIADVPVTALSHLCVPIDNNWQLDGVSLIPDCIGTMLETIDGESRSLIKITDVLGRDIKGVKNEPLLYIYDDGTVEKKITFE